jgi:hypothetical protein
MSTDSIIASNDPSFDHRRYSNPQGRSYTKSNTSVVSHRSIVKSTNSFIQQKQAQQEQQSITAEKSP